MTEGKYEAFFTILKEMVNENKPYKEKIEELKGQMTDEDETNIQELITWFDEDDEEEDDEDTEE